MGWVDLEVSIVGASKRQGVGFKVGLEVSTVRGSLVLVGPGVGFKVGLALRWEKVSPGVPPVGCQRVSIDPQLPPPTTIPGSSLTCPPHYLDHPGTHTGFPS